MDCIENGSNTFPAGWWWKVKELVCNREVTMKQLHTWLKTVLFTVAYVLGGQVNNTGILIDAICGEVAALNFEKAYSHKVSSSLSLNYRESAFGIITPWKIILVRSDWQLESPEVA